MTFYNRAILVLFLIFFMHMCLYIGLTNANDMNIEQLLMKEIQSGKTEIYIMDIARFDWEKVCISSPYISRDDLEDRLGIKYDEYDSIDWIMMDGCWGLFFINGNNVSYGKILVKNVGEIVDDNHEERLCRDKKARLIIENKKGRYGIYRKLYLR